MARRTTTTKVLDDTMLSKVRGWHQLGQKSKEALTNIGVHTVGDLGLITKERILDQPWMGDHAFKKIIDFRDLVRSYQTQGAPVISAPSSGKDEIPAPEPRPQATIQLGEYTKLANAAAKIGQALFVEVIEEKQGVDDELGLVSIDPHSVSHIDRGRYGDDPMIHWDTGGGAQSAKVRHGMEQIYHVLQVAREQSKK